MAMLNNQRVTYGKLLGKTFEKKTKIIYRGIIYLIGDINYLEDHPTQSKEKHRKKNMGKYGKHMGHALYINRSSFGETIWTIIPLSSCLW